MGVSEDISPLTRFIADFRNHGGGLERDFPGRKDHIFTLARAPKVAPPMGPICAGPTLLAVLTAKRISTQATYAAPEKPLTSSAATRSNVQSNTNVQPFSAASGATVKL
jgi:hypothetical protein